MPSGKRRAASAHEIAAMAAAQPEEIRSRRTAAEQTYQHVLNRLGAKGTYEKVGGGPSLGLGGAAGAAPEDAFKEVNAADLSAAVRNVDRRFTDPRDMQKFQQLDPTKATQQIEKSSQFRIMSRLTAESEQLLAREGDLYDDMLKHTQLPILEGSAAMARENAEEIKRAFARGGSARRQAFEAVEKIRQKHRNNSKKVQLLAERRFELDKWARENARDNLKFGQEWAANLGGVRETFNQAMDNASALMLTQALPTMFKAKQKAYDARDAAHARNRAKVTKWISGITQVVGTFMGAPGMGGSLFGQAAGVLQDVAGKATGGVLRATGLVGAETTRTS